MIDDITVITVSGRMVILVNGHRLTLTEQQAATLNKEISRATGRVALDMQGVAVLLSDYQTKRIRAEVPRVLKIIRDTK